MLDIPWSCRKDHINVALKAFQKSLRILSAPAILIIINDQLYLLKFPGTVRPEIPFDRLVEGTTASKPDPAK